MLLGAAAAANWNATYQAVTSQPNWPAIDHRTPWTLLAPHMADGAVAAGPARAVAIVVACGCALIVGRRLRTVRQRSVEPGDTPGAAVVGRAGPGATRVFEPVMVAFYLWPPLAVALVVAARSRRRLVCTSVVVAAVTLGSQSSWRSPWGWWGFMVAGLALTLFFAGGHERYRLGLTPSSTVDAAGAADVGGGEP